MGRSSLAARTGQLWYDAHASDLEEAVHCAFSLQNHNDYRWIQWPHRRRLREPHGG